MVGAISTSDVQNARKGNERKRMQEVKREISRE